MRLLFVHPFLSSFGGAQLALMWLVHGMHKRGHQVKICAGANPNHLESQLASFGIEVSIRKETGRSPSSWIAEESKDYDLIIAGNYPSTLWVQQPEGTPKRPVLWNCNEPPRPLYEETMSTHFLRSAVDPKFYFPWSGFVKKKKTTALAEEDQAAVRSINQIVTISRQTANWVGTIYGRNAPVVSLGIGDMQLQAQCFPPGPFIFFSPAGIEPIKNFVTVLKSFQIFLKNAPSAQARLWLTGGGTWRHDAECLSRSLGIAANVEFLGALPRNELLDCYAKCHAVVFVPLDEPFGLVSCEAGLAGKPVIASHHGGPAEVIVDQETGLLVNPLAAETIAEAMKRLFQDRVLCARMGEKGKQRISGKYGFNRYLEEFEQVCVKLNQPSGL